MIDDLARRLVNAADRGTAIPPLTDSTTALDSDIAYDIRDRLIDARTARGSSVVGAKLGLTSIAKQRQMNVDEPLYGILTSDMRLESGAVVARSDYIQPRCEPEIAFLLNRDLRGGHVQAADVLAATSLVFPAIDVLDSRFAGYTFTITDVIADNASSAGFAIGGDGVTPNGIDLRLVGCAFEVNGVLVATAAGAAVLGNPAEAVAWMVRKMAMRGQGVVEGDVVMAGALTEAFAVEPGDVVAAHFDRLGSVTLNWS